jgi:hypothetical protein
MERFIVKQKSRSRFIGVGFLFVLLHRNYFDFEQPDFRALSQVLLATLGQVFWQALSQALPVAFGQSFVPALEHDLSAAFGQALVPALEHDFSQALSQTLLAVLGHEAGALTAEPQVEGQFFAFNVIAPNAIKRIMAKIANLTFLFIINPFFKKREKHNLELPEL